MHSASSGPALPLSACSNRPPQDTIFSSLFPQPGELYVVVFLYFIFRLIIKQEFCIYLVFFVRLFCFVFFQMFKLNKFF